MMSPTTLQEILQAYDLTPNDFSIGNLGSGLINLTWKITGRTGEFVLQRINKQVFTNPQIIADNLYELDQYLKATVPGYLFVAPLKSRSGDTLVYVEENYYRLFPFIEKSHTVDFLTADSEAYEAAKQFGRFSRLLDNIDLSALGTPLPHFHDLTLRLNQFDEALANAPDDRKQSSAIEISEVIKYRDILTIYESLVNEASIPLRVIHHDTKINNVLFDDHNKGMCVIDLDTVMPGYFISDVGDMMRTYLAAANEEETDLEKINIRESFFAAIYSGYMEEMGEVLTETEEKLFIYSGEFMIYMQAVRFLTDYLNGDTYYATKYPGHNLKRAQNQLFLLKLYKQHENAFKQIIKKEGVPAPDIKVAHS